MRSQPASADSRRRRRCRRRRLQGRAARPLPMVLIYKPSGPAGQLANLCFYAAALVSDVLLIRLFLVLAYVWLLCCK